MKRLSFLIVNYNTFDLCIRCAQSIVRHGLGSESDLIFVDNRSPDGSGKRLAEHFPKATVFQSERNDGYGAGINIGMRHVTTDLALILNPDTYFEEDRISQAVSLFDRDPSVAVVALRLVYPDGELQYAGRTFYSWLDILLRRSVLGHLAVFRQRVDRHLMKGVVGNDCYRADWVMGTGFIIRKSAFDAIGGMDEGYFLYCEDVDLCARLWLSGWAVMCTNGVTLVHDHQRHSKAGLLSSAGRIHLKSMYRFSRKFGIPLYRRPTVDYFRRRWEGAMRTTD